MKKIKRMRKITFLFCLTNLVFPHHLSRLIVLLIPLTLRMSKTLIQIRNYPGMRIHSSCSCHPRHILKAQVLTLLLTVVNKTKDCPTVGSPHQNKPSFVLTLSDVLQMLHLLSLSVKVDLYLHFTFDALAFQDQTVHHRFVCRKLMTFPTYRFLLSSRLQMLVTPETTEMFSSPHATDASIVQERNRRDRRRDKQ